MDRSASCLAIKVFPAISFKRQSSWLLKFSVELHMQVLRNVGHICENARSSSTGSSNGNLIGDIIESNGFVAGPGIGEGSGGGNNYECAMWKKKEEREEK
jgi:hypothetical protein